MGKKKLADELLRQNGLVRGTATDGERTQLHRMIVREKARAGRMKVATIVSWTLLFVCFVVLALKAHFSGPGSLPAGGYGLFALLVLFYVAVTCSVSWFLRSRSASRREVLEKLAELEAKVELLSQHRAAEGSDSAAPTHQEE